jgi:Flp pilus assembly protein TadG
VTRPHCADAERGTATVELVVLAPVLFALLAFIVGLGRAADARGRLVGAVRDAARAASLALTPAAAEQGASSTALADLHGAGLECRAPQVTTDTSRFHPGGQVQVTVRCTLDLSTLVISGLPGHTGLTAHATAPLDTYSDATGLSGGAP